MASILVIDDERGIREHLEDILGSNGHHVELAESAEQARASRSFFKPDLVLLDIWMPVCNGVTLLKEWASGGMLHVPVIMMGGHATLDLAAEAKEIGSHSFLEKPITQKRLLEAVEKGLAFREIMKPSAVAANPVLAKSVEAQKNPVETFPSGVTSNVVNFSTGALFPDVQNGPEYTVEQACQDLGDSLLSQQFKVAMHMFERAYFQHHLVKGSGSMTRISCTTGIDRTHLYRKLKTLGVDMSIGKAPKVSKRNKNQLAEGESIEAKVA